MKYGTLYGIGVGPGDPELVTVKGANILSRCRHVFTPKARVKTDSLALAIAERYIGKTATVHELVFPMTSDPAELLSRWRESASEILTILERGEDACFLTIGDPLLYSTYIYLLREIRAMVPGIGVVTVPGVTAFSAAAALAEFAVGEAKDPVLVVPTADDLDAVRQSLKTQGTVILMKIGKRLPDILHILEEAALLDRSVFVSHAGMESQRVETDSAHPDERRCGNRLSVHYPGTHEGRANEMKVIFVGAGPGDPELLTLKAARILANCRICIYAGSLVSPDVMDMVSPQAERHNSAGMSLEEIIRVCGEAKEKDIDVVRLHSGDPSIYGAIREQMNELDRLQISYEVGPGREFVPGSGRSPAGGTDGAGGVADDHPDAHVGPHALAGGAGTRSAGPVEGHALHFPVGP